MFVPSTRVRTAFAIGMLALISASGQTPAQPAKKSERTEPAKQDSRSGDIPVAGLAAPVDPNSYVIGPEDVLAIRVWREPDLSTGVVVRPDGRITLPLAGELQASGLTPSQLTAKVVEAYSKYLNRPEVTVSVQNVMSKRYFITGKVAQSGAVPLVTPTTVLDAITMAGGLEEFAKSSKIVIMRGKERLKFNYKDVVKGKNLEQNIYLQPGDYVYVP